MARIFFAKRKKYPSRIIKCSGPYESAKPVGFYNKGNPTSVLHIKSDIFRLRLIMACSLCVCVCVGGGG